MKPIEETEDEAIEFDIWQDTIKRLWSSVFGELPDGAFYSAAPGALRIDGATMPYQAQLVMRAAWDRLPEIMIIVQLEIAEKTPRTMRLWADKVTRRICETARVEADRIAWFFEIKGEAGFDRVLFDRQTGDQIWRRVQLHDEEPLHAN